MYSYTWSIDLLKDVIIENFIGFERRSCCLKKNLVGFDYITSILMLLNMPDLECVFMIPVIGY